MNEYIGYEKESPFPIIDGSHPKYAVLTDEEIVRCRDCKHYKDYGDGGTKCDNIRWNTVIYGAYVSPLVTSEGYCAWGEKR